MRNAVAKVTEYLRKILKSGKSKMNKFPGAEKCGRESAFLAFLPR